MKAKWFLQETLRNNLTGANMYHKFLHSFVSLTLALAFLAATLTPQPARAAGPWYVATSGDDNNDCLSPVNPCATIQGAIGKASAEDTINVAVGTYTGTGTEVVLIDKDISISGGWDANFFTQSGMSTIDGQLTRRGSTVNGGVTATIEHLIIYNCASYDGSGIYNGGTLTLTNSSISGNTWDGVYNHNGTLTLTNSSISGNTYSGSYSDGGVVTLNNSTVANNGQTGVQNINGTLILNNSTLSGNMNGAIFNFMGTVTLNNSTVSSNISQIGGSSAGGVYNAGGIVILQNSIVAGNIDAAGVSPDCHGNISSSGYNLIGNTSGCTFTLAIGDLTSVDPLLGPLQDNGGPTFTHALLPGSPAIDAGNPSGCTDQNGNLLTTDQRGVTRPQGPRCDIGAFELEVTNPVKEVTIDIKPGSYPNSINLGSKGVVPVAVLTTAGFNARDLDPSTVLFAGAAPVRWVYKDVNYDGNMDLLFHFKTKALKLDKSSTDATLTGKTFAGMSVEGTDSVRIVPPSYP